MSATTNICYQYINSHLDNFKQIIDNFNDSLKLDDIASKINYFQFENLFKLLEMHEKGLSGHEIKALKTKITIIKIDFEHKLAAAAERIDQLAQANLADATTSTQARQLIAMAETSLLSSQMAPKFKTELEMIIQKLNPFLSTNQSQQIQLPKIPDQTTARNAASEAMQFGDFLEDAIPSPLPSQPLTLPGIKNVGNNKPSTLPAIELDLRTDGIPTDTDNVGGLLSKACLPKNTVPDSQTQQLKQLPTVPYISHQNSTKYLHLYDPLQGRTVKHLFGDVFKQGGMGEIRKVINCFNNHIEIFKQARLDQGYSSVRGIINEYNQLVYVNKNGKCWGIQESPRALLKLNDSKNTELTGYLGPEYKGNYKEHLAKTKNKFEDYLIDIHQILCGLFQLAMRNILHGDLKRDNVFVKHDSDGTTLVHIADFGTTVIADDSKTIAQLCGFGKERAHNRHYYPYKDLRDSQILADKGERKALIKVERKRDVFAGGAIIYVAIEGKHPFPFDNYNCPITTEPFKAPTRIQVPEPIVKLLRQMLLRDSNKRYSAHKAFATYTQFLRDNYPETLNKIEDKIRKEYPGTILLK